MEDKIVEFRMRGKLKQKTLSKEAIALKQIRVNKKIPREVVCQSLGISMARIQRYETGQSKLPDSIKSLLLRRYRVSQEEFQKILSGEVVLPNLPAHTVHKRIGAGSYVRRFDTKNITKEVRVLKVMRNIRGLSQAQAGELCGVHRKSIGHIEDGRINLTDKKISMLLKAYQFSDSDFREMVEDDILRDEVINQCIEILKTIEKDKLKAVSALLINFK